MGVMFSDVKQCKKAVTQHVIIHDHAFRPTRTDHNKFRAVCKRADKDFECDVGIVMLPLLDL
jgi:hypothetical protein